MSLCNYSISKNHHFSTRWAPNPQIKPPQFFKFEAFCENLSSCFLVKAVHADGVGVVYPDDSVSDRNASFEVEPEDEVRGVVNGAPGTHAEEAHEANNEIRLKKSGDFDENVSNSRFKLRNGREVFEERAYIVGMARKGDDANGSFGIEDSLSESEQLADTAGLAFLGSTYQNKCEVSCARSRDCTFSRKVEKVLRGVS